MKIIELLINVILPGYSHLMDDIKFAGPCSPVCGNSAKIGNCIELFAESPRAWLQSWLLSGLPYYLSWCTYKLYLTWWLCVCLHIFLPRLNFISTLIPDNIYILLRDIMLITPEPLLSHVHPLCIFSIFIFEQIYSFAGCGLILVSFWIPDITCCCPKESKCGKLNYLGFCFSICI